MFLWFSYGFPIYDMVLPYRTGKFTGHWQYAQAPRRQESAEKFRLEAQVAAWAGDFMGFHWGVAVDLPNLVMTNTAMEKDG